MRRPTWPLQTSTAEPEDRSEYYGLGNRPVRAEDVLAASQNRIVVVVHAPIRIERRVVFLHGKVRHHRKWGKPHHYRPHPKRHDRDRAHRVRDMYLQPHYLRGEYDPRGRRYR